MEKCKLDHSRVKFLGGLDAAEDYRRILDFALCYAAIGGFASRGAV